MQRNESNSSVASGIMGLMMIITTTLLLGACCGGALVYLAGLAA